MRKKLNINAKRFELDDVLIPYIQQTNQESQFAYQNQQNICTSNNYQRQPSQNQSSNKSMKIQQIVEKVNVDSKQNNNQSKQQLEIQKPIEPDQIKLDPKLGYWTYTQQEYKDINEKKEKYKKDLKIYEDQIKQARMLELRKRSERYAKLKEKQEKRNNLLDMKKIHKLIRQLRINYNKYQRKEKIKHFGYTLDEANNVQIVEQQKKKKMTKLKKAKIQWDNQNEYETVNEDDQDLQQLISKLSNENKYSQEKYNNMPIRPWITQIPCKELDDLVLVLINELSYAQQKKKVIEPKKFKKRITAGFKECFRSIQSNLIEKQSKLIIIPINIQQYPVLNGPDHQVLKILKECYQHNIPIIYASNRSKLGRAYSGKFGPKISMISIINYQNFEETFQKLLILRNQAIEQYVNKFGYVNIMQLIMEQKSY